MIISRSMFFYWMVNISTGELRANPSTIFPISWPYLGAKYIMLRHTHTSWIFNDIFPYICLIFPVKNKVFHHHYQWGKTHWYPAVSTIKYQIIIDCRWYSSHEIPVFSENPRSTVITRLRRHQLLGPVLSISVQETMCPRSLGSISGARRLALRQSSAILRK